jgi:hypothetical protein
MPDITTMSIDRIMLESDLQSRAGINGDAVDDYADQYRAGNPMPPVTVFRDEHDNYWLADGFHRVAAAQKAGIDEIDVDVREGTYRDAKMYAVGANATHGLRRTKADKRRSVEMALADEEWSQLSNCEIARRCAVSEGLVRVVRSVTSYNTSEDDRSVALHETKDGSRRVPYRNKHGGYSVMNTANIGKNRRRVEAQAQPASAASPPAPQEPRVATQLEDEVMTFVEDDIWGDWCNRLPNPRYSEFPSVDVLEKMSPQQAAEAIVRLTSAESGDPRIPSIDNVTTTWEFRQAYWRAMLEKAKECVGE